MLHDTMALVALAGGGERHAALRETVAGLLALDEPRRRTAARMAGLDIRYGPGDGHPLVGRRMPDLVRATPTGPWVLPVVGEVTPVAAVLIRPDGHVAWAGDPADPGLPLALATWFGQPVPA